MRRSAGFTAAEMMVALLLVTFLLIVLIPIGGLLGEHFTMAADYATDLQRGVLVADRIAREVRCAHGVAPRTADGARASGGATLVLEDSTGGTVSFALEKDRARSGRIVLLERRDTKGALLGIERLGIVGGLSFRYGTQAGQTKLVYFDVDLVPRGAHARRAALSSCARVADGERAR